MPGSFASLGLLLSEAFLAKACLPRGSRSAVPRFVLGPVFLVKRNVPVASFSILVVFFAESTAGLLMAIGQAMASFSVTVW